MLMPEGEFLRPTTQNRMLAILEALTDNAAISQSELGIRTGLSSAMVNGYLKQMREDGLVERRPLNAKSYEYLLTQSGRNVRREYFGEYCAEIVRSYTAIKRHVQDKLEKLAQEGKQRLVLWGASETCDIVLSALRETPLTVLALVDSNPAKHGTLLAGHAIFPPAVLTSMNCDAVVITSFGQAANIYEQLQPLANDYGLEVVRL